MTQYDPLYLLSTGGQQEGEHGRVKHVQGEHYQRQVVLLKSQALRIFSSDQELKK